jgi:hypothetical protein
MEKYRTLLVVSAHAHCNLLTAFRREKASGALKQEVL